MDEFSHRRVQRMNSMSKSSLTFFHSGKDGKVGTKKAEKKEQEELLLCERRRFVRPFEYEVSQVSQSPSPFVSAQKLTMGDGAQ